MALASLLVQTASHRRLTSTIAAPTACPFTASPAWTSVEPARVKLNGDAMSANITVAITGSLNGIAQTESIAVPAATPGVAISGLRWTAISEVSSPDTATGALTAVAIEATGKLVYTEVVINAALRCRLRQRIFDQEQPEQGTVQQEKWLLYVIGQTVQPKDIIVLDNVRYNVENVYPVTGATTYHHSEIYLKRLG